MTVGKDFWIIYFLKIVIRFSFLQFNFLCLVEESIRIVESVLVVFEDIYKLKVQYIFPSNLLEYQRMYKISEVQKIDGFRR